MASNMQMCTNMQYTGFMQCILPIIALVRDWGRKICGFPQLFYGSGLQGNSPVGWNIPKQLYLGTHVWLLAYMTVCHLKSLFSDWYTWMRTDVCILTYYCIVITCYYKPHYYLLLRSHYYLLLQSSLLPVITVPLLHHYYIVITSSLLPVITVPLLHHYYIVITCYYIFIITCYYILIITSLLHCYYLLLLISLLPVITVPLLRHYYVIITSLLRHYYFM